MSAAQDLPLFVAVRQVDVLERALHCIVRAKTTDEQLSALTDGEHALKDLARLKAAHRRERERQRPEGTDDDDDQPGGTECARVGRVRVESRTCWSVRVEVWMAHRPAEIFDVLVTAPSGTSGWSGRVRRGPVPYSVALKEAAVDYAVREVIAALDGEGVSDG